LAGSRHYPSLARDSRLIPGPAGRLMLAFGEHQLSQGSGAVSRPKSLV